MLKFWIDIDNTPHVLFAKPIIRYISQKQHNCIITIRNTRQVQNLALEYGYKFTIIGQHYGKSTASKIHGTLLRVMLLIPWVIKTSPNIAISHGSRSQAAICKLFRIPKLIFDDYEHANEAFVCHPTWCIVPKLLEMHWNYKVDFVYPGTKESVYIYDQLHNDKRVYNSINYKAMRQIYVRPAADDAHYHINTNRDLLGEVMRRFRLQYTVDIIILARSEMQSMELRRDYAEWHGDLRIKHAKNAVNGVFLMQQCGILVGGGGTMNREALTIGVKVYSIFEGAMGTIDNLFAERGNLCVLKSHRDIARCIKDEQSNRRASEINSTGLISIQHILETLIKHCDCNTINHNKA